MLKYDTLYQSLKKVSAEWHGGKLQNTFYWSYMKFFENGTLIEAMIASDNFYKINLNFTTKTPFVITGTFSIDGKEIKINLNNTFYKGGFTLEGIIIQNQQNLTWDLYTGIII